MSLDTLFDNFDMLTNAPNGIKKLRELILQLAVQGRLVPQDPADEPASVLLEKVKAEKEKLIKEGKIKKSKPLPPIREDEMPYELPKGWKWSRLGECTFCRDAERVPLSKTERSKRIGTYDYYGASGVIDKIDGYLFTKPLLLIGEDGANLLLRSTPVAFIARGKYWVNNHAHVLDSINENFLEYLKVFINSIKLTPYITGTAQPKMNQMKMNSIIVAIPPLPEQHRIVVKVDKLMNLCDELEAQKQKAEKLHIQLNSSSLDKLLIAQASDSFSEHWQQIINNFDLLYNSPESISKLRESILQLAVQGKLIPQDPDDDPASVLLEKVKSEKERLIKEGKIKKSKPLPPIREDEIPYELPKGWEWVRLEQTCNNIHYGYTASAIDNFKDIRLLRITDIQNGKVNWQRVPGCEIDKTKLDNYILHSGDLLIARTGGTVGKTFLVENLPVCAVFASYLIRIKISSYVFKKYIKYYTESPLYWNQLYAKCSGTGQPNVNATSLKSLIIPIPPFSEQHRIVAKVDKLMSLCDELEAKLSKSQVECSKLMESVAASISFN